MCYFDNSDELILRDGVRPYQTTPLFGIVAGVGFPRSGAELSWGQKAVLPGTRKVKSGRNSAGNEDTSTLGRTRAGFKEGPAKLPRPHPPLETTKNRHVCCYPKYRCVPNSLLNV